MSIRLAVYQRDTRSLEGLCAQLQCAGYDVVERYTQSAFLDLVGENELDALLLEADARGTATLLEAVKASPETCHLPILLIAEEDSPALDRLSMDHRIDDIVILPVLRGDLRARVRSLARLASMTTELERRQRALSDFGIDMASERSVPAEVDRIQILLVGPVGDQQVDMIDGLGNAATFAYAETTDQASHLLGQCCVDMVVMTDKMASGEIGELCRRIKATAELADLPILLSGDPERAPILEAICRDENVELLRAPIQAVALQKRFQTMLHQHRLKRQLRGMMVDGLYNRTMDNLTGLYGRGFLYHYLGRSMDEGRLRGCPLSVATCSISGLSEVNDALGYPLGDELIAQLGKALVGCCRAQDLVARASGKSFCIILNDTRDIEAHVVCERVTETLEAVIDRSGSRFPHVHLTIGLTQMSLNDRPETLMDRAFQQPSIVALREAS